MAIGQSGNRRSAHRLAKRVLLVLIVGSLLQILLTNVGIDFAAVVLPVPMLALAGILMWVIHSADVDAGSRVLPQQAAWALKRLVSRWWSSGRWLQLPSFSTVSAEGSSTIPDRLTMTTKRPWRTRP
jgi:hypothetical protein